MMCPKCKSTNVTLNVATTEKKKARHGALYWIFIGWWLHPILWICATLPMLIWRVINPNRKTKTVTTTYAVCQNCGHSWVVDQ